MGAKGEFFVRFWGTRGSIACSGADTVRYGGNTSCLEVRCGKRLLIFDAGTGLRYLGNALIEQNGRIDADLLLTHTHYDHIGGLPFFRPMFVPENSFRIWAGHLLPDYSVHQALDDMMVAPLFPVPLGILRAHIEFHDFHAGESLELGDDIEVQTAALNHPNGATGYRIGFEGKSICYVTDTEHKDGELDQNIVDLARDADIFIYDSSFTAEEYPSRVGWGHSTWEEGVRLSDAAGVGTFVVFHHDPDHDDAFMDEVSRQVTERRPASVVARDGMVLTP